MLDGERADQPGVQTQPQWGLTDFLERFGRPAPWGGFDEESAAGLCYTSGTVGNPRGVLYTHRSNYLHTLRSLQADSIALTAADTVLVAVPMFHANGWGFQFAAPAAGARMVLPGRSVDPAHLRALIQGEGVTVAAAVQTVWLGLVDLLDSEGGQLPSLQRIIIGGDVIVAIDGEKIASQSDMNLVLNRKRPGDTVSVSVYRGGKKIDVPVKLGERAGN